MSRAALAAICAALMWVSPAMADVEIPAGGVMTLTSGGLDLACTDLIVAGRLQADAAVVNNVRHVVILPGGEIDGGTSTIRVSGNWTNHGVFVPDASTVIMTDGCGVDPATVSGDTTFFNLTFRSDTGKTWVLEPGSVQRVLGMYSLLGDPSHKLTLTNGGGATPAYVYPLGQQYSLYATTTGIGPFPAKSWSIATVVEPANAGTVSCTPNPVGDGGNSTCTATAKTGYLFGRFSANCERTTGTSCVVRNVMGPQTVTAVFDALPPGYVSLRVGKTGSGGGTVTSQPGGIDCGPEPTCGGNFWSGSQLTLNARPFDGSEFAGWTGACTGNSCVLTLDANKAVVATFRYTGTNASFHLAQDLYIAYYGRPAEPEGRAYWAGQADKAGGFSAVVNAFGNSAEFVRRYGGLSDEAMVTKIYQQTLHRDPDPAGLAWYLAEIRAGRQTFATIALAVLNGAFKAPDSTVIENKGDVADYYTAKVMAGCAYGGEQAGVDALTPVTADLVTVVAAKAALDLRCGR